MGAPPYGEGGGLYRADDADDTERHDLDREIQAANASGNTPVVFIHGLWLLPSSG